MPIIAVAGVIGGASSLIGGGLTVLETIAAVGTVVGSIGALTGNPTLTKIGAVAGLAGGIGAFAQNQGWLASSDAASTAAAAANDDSSTLEANKSAPSSVQVDVAPASDAANLPSPTNQPPQTNVMGGMPGPTPPNGLMSAGSGAPPAFNPAQDSQAAYAPQAPAGQAAAPGAAPSASGKIMDLFNQMFRGTDGKLNKEMLSLAGNFVGGAFDKNKAAQTDLYGARADAERQQLANGNAVPALNRGTAQAAPVFKPTSPTYNPVRPAGLFNAR